MNFKTGGTCIALLLSVACGNTSDSGATDPMTSGGKADDPLNPTGGGNDDDGAASDGGGESTGGAGEGGTDGDAGSTGDDVAATVPWCAAIKGNGPRITAHFSAMARLSEHFGAPVGAAGGSSASITTYFTEAIVGGGLIDECDGGPCSPTERGARAALLFKSVFGVVGSSTNVAVGADFAVLLEVYTQIEDQGVVALLDGETPQDGVQALLDILQSETVRALINPELIELLVSSPNPVGHAQELISGLSDALSFAPPDQGSFVRPAVLSWDGFASLAGRLGNFYAGHGPADRDGLTQWLADCAEPTWGLTWIEAREVAAGSSTCGQRFTELYADFVAASDTDTSPSFAERSVGSTALSIPMTGVITGDAVDQWLTARAGYEALEPYTFAPEFSDVKVGYWADPAVWDRMDAGLSRRNDALGNMRANLGAPSWEEVLARSPAEPGLSEARAVPTDPSTRTVGGWPDPVPALAAREAGCEIVIGITRPGGAGSFLEGTAFALGATPEDLEPLYGLTESSSFQAALEESDGVYCPDWDSPPLQDLEAMFNAGYDAGLEIHNPALEQVEHPIANSSDNLGLPGCTPGVSAN